MLTNWKTSLMGVIVALSGLYNAVIANKPVQDTIWQFAAAVGLIASRDHDK